MKGKPRQLILLPLQKFLYLVRNSPRIIKYPILVSTRCVMEIGGATICHLIFKLYFNSIVDVLIEINA
jgi:hypothetical protein